MTHKHTQNEILIQKRKQNAYEVVRFPIIAEKKMKRGEINHTKWRNLTWFSMLKSDVETTLKMGCSPDVEIK